MRLPHGALRIDIVLALRGMSPGRFVTLMRQTRLGCAIIPGAAQTFLFDLGGTLFRFGHP